MEGDKLDVLIVGAGFSGLHLLQKLRKLNFNANIYEAGKGIGGTWYWNRYTGARVDSDFPFYQFTQDDIWKDFKFTERFPARAELIKYFNYVDEKLDLNRHIKFDARVTSAKYDGSEWLVEINNNKANVTRAKFIILCTGFAECRHTPSFKGLDTFKGVTVHTSLWPESGIDVAGKRVAVIGTGASGVQVIQEFAPIVDHLTVYQRTPNLALPMQQSFISDQTKWKFPAASDVQEIFNKTRTSFGGMGFDFIPTNGSDATPEEQEAVFEDLYRRGGFYFWVGNYQDIFVNPKTNDAAYQFWCKKARSRINDPVKRDILAPLVAPHPFGTKRPSLEQCYYEKYNQDNVDIINVRQSPILEITENGVRTEKEGVIDVDVIVFATGFDQSGTILNIELRNERNESIQDKWKNGVWTNIGISTAGFPNMFFTYGPHAPTAIANGPTCVEIQGDWIIELLDRMRKDNKTKIVATEEAEIKWKDTVNVLWNRSLFPLADSWYQSANIPGKPREALNFAGGIPLYLSILDECAKNNYKDFVLS
ncbi:hypothetical protein HA402_010426 [Bradysia odoriphaga]|nr:hypothetical protein HA402_010426 [Bradysia odoriphaga]